MFLRHSGAITKIHTTIAISAGHMKRQSRAILLIQAMAAIRMIIFTTKNKLGLLHQQIIGTFISRCVKNKIR